LLAWWLGCGSALFEPCAQHIQHASRTRIVKRKTHLFVPLSRRDMRARGTRSSCRSLDAAMPCSSSRQKVGAAVTRSQWQCCCADELSQCFEDQPSFQSSQWSTNGSRSPSGTTILAVLVQQCFPSRTTAHVRGGRIASAASERYARTHSQHAEKTGEHRTIMAENSFVAIIAQRQRYLRSSARS